MSFADLFKGSSRTWGKPTGPKGFFVVQQDAEFERISGLPRRVADKVDLTNEFRKPGSDRRLWPIQSLALHEARREAGLFGAIGVGHGKFLISMLLPVAMQARVAVYLCPAQLKKQVLKTDYPNWHRHFYLPKLGQGLHVVSYEELSRAATADILERLQPDLIVADEGHKLRHKDAARTKRFLRYMRASGADLALLSGTITTRSLKDYAHLIELCLRRTSPVPLTRDWDTLKQWAEALDSPKKGEEVRAPGVLLRFCTDEELQKLATKEIAAQEAARLGFRRRLIDTAGVVVSDEQSVSCSLNISARMPKMPATVQAVLQRLRATWTIGDEEIEEAPRLWAVARQVSMGFYYEWDWPNGIKDQDWLNARRFWHRELRHFLQHAARKGLDSPFLVANAIMRGEDIGHPELRQAWQIWSMMKSRPQPPTVVRWIDDYIVRDVQAFLEEDDGEPAIVWYEQKAVGEALSRLPGLTYFPPGDNKLVQLADRLGPEDRAPHILISAEAHGTGKNLQTGWARNLVTCPHPSGTVWEQAYLGRTHRQGQWRDEVTAEVNVHTTELLRDFDQARRDAAYQEQTTSRQKLRYATLVGFDRAHELHALADDSDSDDEKDGVRP